MKTSKKGVKSEEYYTPAPKLKRLITILLQVQEKRVNLEAKKNAGEEAQSKDKGTLSKLENMANSKKVTVLNRYVFQSMANLTFLLEQMQKEPYIRKRFEDDIKVLFFKESSKRPGDPILFRFLRACVMKYERGKAHSTAETPDFRYILAEYMQRSVMMLMQEIGPHQSDLDALVLNKINEEVGNAFAWVKVFAQQPRRELDADMENRPEIYEQRPASF
jgi:hypothetical protein